jgi:pyruvate kinase
LAPEVRQLFVARDNGYTSLHVSVVTPKDLVDLKFVAKHADVVELSFANSADDVRRLQQELKRLGARKIGIILKIESRQGFEALPSMLCTMIARGDLAVECGFERVAELQEEILWVCEAARRKSDRRPNLEHRDQ